MTNIERLKSLSDEDFAKWLCHEKQSNNLTMAEIADVLDEYKNSTPPDFKSCWLG